MEAYLAAFFAPVTDFVAAHAEWAGPIVFAISFVESLAIVTAVVPGTVLLFAIGGLAAAGTLDLFTLSLWGTAGAGLGFWVSFEAGRRYARQIEALPWLVRRPELVARGHAFFVRWGALAVLAGRFVGPGRVVVPLLAGTLGESRRSFHVVNWASAALWAPVMLAPGTIGAWLAAQLEALPPALRSTVTIALLALAFFAVRAFRR